MTKEQIFELIRQDGALSALEALMDIFPDNDQLNNLMDELIEKPNNFNKVEHLGRLRLFVSKNLKSTAPVNIPAQKQTADVIYDILCEIDFKLQTKHFKIYKHKTVSAFLLHGNSDENGNDMKWLYNQLLYKEKLLQERCITIDFNSVLGGSFERILEELYKHFQIVTTGVAPENHRNKLRKAIEGRLESENIICIIKNPETILNNTMELGKLFDDLLLFMEKNIAREEQTKSLVFLFVESRLSDMQAKEAKYFLWYKQAEHNYNHTAAAMTSPELRIVDLGPVGRVTQQDIENWMSWALEDRNIYQHVCMYQGKEAKLIENCLTPFSVITKISNDLKFKIEDKWIH